MADSPEERAHWRKVLQAYDGYMAISPLYQHVKLSANQARRMAFLQLPKESKQMHEALGYREKLEAVDEGIRRNAEFIDEMIADPVFSDMLAEPPSHSPLANESNEPVSSGSSAPRHAHEMDDSSHSHSHPHSSSHSHPHNGNHHQSQTEKPTQADTDLAQDKIRSTLRSFVRDWAEEGREERKACYDPCLAALERHWKGKERDRGDIKVLVPGCGLGRLAMEIAARGFASQGNEFSTYMLIASHFILNQTSEAKSHSIHSFSNHPSTVNLLRRVDIPDICPSEVLGQGQGGDFSLVAGDFEEIYQAEDQKGVWGGVVTCFFIDCARNVLTFLRIIYDILEEDGIWINIGPLLWHFENSPTTSHKGEGSIELSLDEVKHLARMVGFDVHEEKMVRTSYTGIPGGMLRHEYDAAFWVATKRDCQA